MDRLICAPESLAQSVLVALCDDTRIQARALKYLGELEDYALRRTTANKNTTATTTTAAKNNTKSDDQPDKGGSSTSSNPLKRKKPMEPGQICLQCKHAFIPSGNAAEACLYHPGELDLDEEHSTWDDWDEDVSGPHDSPENREDHPEGFVWDCCDGNGLQPGCTRGYHVAIRRPLLKKLRAGVSPEDDFVRMFEGRALKANEFVNELLWTNEWYDFAASRTFSGWGATEEQDVSQAADKDDEEPNASQVAEKDEEEQAEDDGDDKMDDVAQLETRTDHVGGEGATPPPPTLDP